MDKKYQLKLKERLKASNLLEEMGLPPDPWVVEYRRKQNERSKRFYNKKPKKEPKENSGRFKKGHVPKHKFTTEDQINYAKEKRKQYSKKWRAENKEKINKYRRDKRKNNPSFKMLSNIRKRLSFLFRLHTNKKSAQTLDLLGCSMEFFIDYISSKFTEGMTLENYGEWHLDHIKPCALFDLTNLKDQKECFHYTNLQPLWAKDNLKKNCKF